jgi:hypothetical protein
LATMFETICSIRTKCWWNSHWMVLFQKFIRRFGPSTKMAPTAELSLIGSVVSEEKIFFKFHPPFFLFLAWRPSWLEVGITGHNFGRGPSKDHCTKAIGPYGKFP